ncbi:extracellular solute-binding protein [Anaerocolumna sedimenticola]|uniref:Extracellular solute-binding protein n=1 Tax=Anaerocolumna sedimenticola TaxID=2696063 RepID=A0A6P1TJM6_9FIRM|nr:ABC transporter substrate-binding protein [Anaerocolumna sedimenticola]QHQ59845.1 extracellular solute-binding protein [Anaerocolumna sedimenticola]
MKKKLLCVLTAVSLIAFSFTGCSGGKTDSTANTDGAKNQSTVTDTKEGSSDAATVDVNEDGTVNNPENVKVDEGKLVFWSLFSGGDGSFMDSIISDYNKTNPAMGVQSIMLVWGDYYTKLQTAVAAKKGPDIGVSHVSKLPELVEQGVVIPIDDYAKEIGVDWSQYADSSKESVTFDGSTYAMPLDTHAEILYFNKDILDKAGVALNSNNQLDIASADDLYAILDKIKGVLPEGASPIAMTNSGDDPYRLWWATYFQMGGTALVNEEGTEVTMNKDIAVKAADFVKGLFDKGYISQGIDDHQKFFQGGQAGLFIGGTWAVGAFEQTENLHFGAQAFPQLFDNSACWADSHTLIIPFNKDRTEEETKAAVEFINYVSSKGAATWAKSGQIPANKSVLESQEYLSLDYRSGYKSALETAILPSKNPNFYSMKDAMITNLNTIWTGQTDTAAAIDSLYGELESNLN